MNKVLMTRNEFRWLMAGMLMVPIAVFMMGLNIGLGLQGESAPAAAEVAQLESTTLEVPAQVTLEDVAALETVVAGMTAQLEKDVEVTPESEELALTLPEPVEVIEVAEEAASVEPVEVAEVADEVIEVESQVVAETETEVSPEMYGVQVGVFSKHENAEGLKQMMTERGYEAQIVENDQRFRVIIQQFADKADAKVAAADYKHAYHADAWVTPLSQSTARLTLAALH